MPQYFWDPSRQRYETRAGRAVSPKQVRAWIDSTITGSRERVRNLTERFVEGRINLPSWATQVQAELKGGHLAMAEIASGGRAQFSPIQAGRVGARLRSEYAFLRNFALQVEQGLAGTPDQIVARAQMYAESLRGTYEGIRRGNMADAGFQMERSVLGVADHCESCVGEADKGWVPMGELIAIGARTCLNNCACSIEFSNSQPI